MKIPITHWGYAELEGVKFILEPWKEQDEACPFEMIYPKNPCPHMGLSEKNIVKWKKVAYLDDDTLSAKRCLKLIPKGINLVNTEYTLIHSKYLPSKLTLKKYLTYTNAIPLFIYGIDSGADMSKLLSLINLECPRPIYFSGKSDIPLPTKIIRYKEK